MLLLLDYALKFSMSSLRGTGSKGEGNPFSFFEKLSKAQLLTVEYVPSLILIMAINYFKALHSNEKKLSQAQKYMFKGAVLSRYIFALRAIDFDVDAKGYPPQGPGTGGLSPFGLVGATMSFSTYFGLIYTALS